MYFKPTCVHSVTTNDYDIENISRSSLQFKWLISKEYQHILSVDPPYGVISPKEIQVFSFGILVVSFDINFLNF